jgi:hypothetical protein
MACRSILHAGVDHQFGARAVELVEEHNMSQHFFLYWAPHKVHSPLQAAPEFLKYYPLDHPPPSDSSPRDAGAVCNFTVDAGSGQGFEKGVLRGAHYFRAVTPATDPNATDTVAGCAALCCATDGCMVFSLNAPWSLPDENGCVQNQSCCSLASNLGAMRKNTYAMNITTGVVQVAGRHPSAGHRCTSTPDRCAQRGWDGGCGCVGMCYCNRRIFRAMVSSVDAMLTNLTIAMKARGLWEDTLLFFLGDNGGPSSSAANNGEFKGMKFGHWEGGHRVPSFVGGPALAPSLQMQWYNHTVHLVDLHATILDLAGLVPQHPSGVMAHDGVSLLPVLNLSLSLATPIRTELWIGASTPLESQYYLHTTLYCFLAAFHRRGFRGRRAPYGGF